MWILVVSKIRHVSNYTISDNSMAPNKTQVFRESNKNLNSIFCLLS